MSTITFMSPAWRPEDVFDFFSSKERKESLTLREGRDAYLVTAVMPGFIKDDFSIRFQGGVLNIYASSHFITHSYAKRTVHKTVRFAQAIDEDQISYLYERNVLKIWIPKKTKSSRFSFGFRLR
jgi:HSP20 family molecular chaperone IbpA